jgi:tRNA (guanine-N7-)-methyltransferase
VRSHELRSFGRKRGRRLSARQHALIDEALPRLVLDRSEPCPASASALFGPGVEEVWLEIGFGGAEHLIWQALHNSAVGLIGSEVFEDGVVKALAGIEEHRLANVRLSRDDARDVLRWLPPASLDRVFILFPDPWPKKRHIKRRLINGALLDLLARAMKPRAELRIGTDIGDYARTILLAMGAQSAFEWQVESAADWRARGPDWPQTRYEAKALREGRRCYFLKFCRS